VGEGLLVCEAARRQAEGYTLKELSRWVIQHRLKVCHWFTVDVFDHLRRGGRVSAGTAVLGTALQIKPLLHVNQDGALAVVEKPRGRKQAMKAQLSKMEQGWSPEMGKTVIVGHGACPDGAQALQAAVQERFPEAEVLTVDIGPIIGAHTGPGMLALIYWGNTR
jgi:DegV family protein with EDD domain